MADRVVDGVADPPPPAAPVGPTSRTDRSAVAINHIRPFSTVTKSSVRTSWLPSGENAAPATLALSGRSRQSAELWSAVCAVVAVAPAVSVDALEPPVASVTGSRHHWSSARTSAVLPSGDSARLPSGNAMVVAAVDAADKG